MTTSEIFYKFVTGSWRIDRQRAREFLALSERHSANRLYAGAQPSVNRPSPAVLSTPEDYRQAYERIVLIRAARQLEEDMPFFDGILGDFETYVVGDLKYRARTGNPEADAEINDFLEWQFDDCDYSQRLDLTKIARLSIRSYKRDGECGFVLIDTGDGIKINYISGDRIGNPLVGANIGPSNFNGIITDVNTGAPIFYDIFRRIPKLNSYVFQMTVAASDFIHLYDPFRFEQYHGVTALKNSIEHGFDIKQIVDFTKLNIKYRASQLPYVTNEQGKPRGTGYTEEAPDPATGTPRPFDIDVGGVTQSFLKLGEGVMEYPNDFPNQQFGSLMEELKRDCAVGLKIPLEFCYRSQSGGVVHRFYVDKAAQTFKEEKRWLKRTLLNRYKNRVIQKGIDTGFLNLDRFTGLSDSMKRFRGVWQMGQTISVDYKNEVQADMMQIDAGVMSEVDYALDAGRDLEAIFAEKEEYTQKVFAAANRISKATGQPVAMVLPFLVKKFPNPGAGMAAPNAANESPSPDDKNQVPA